MTRMNKDAVYYALDVLMQMAKKTGPIKRRSLMHRCGMGESELADAIQYLQSKGLVCVIDDKEYSLNGDPSRITLSDLENGSSEMFFGECGKQITLREACNATSQCEGTLCPYYDACIGIGGPGGSRHRRSLRRAMPLRRDPSALIGIQTT